MRAKGIGFLLMGMLVSACHSPPVEEVAAKVSSCPATTLAADIDEPAQVMLVFGMDGVLYSATGARRPGIWFLDDAGSHQLAADPVERFEYRDGYVYWAARGGIYRHAVVGGEEEVVTSPSDPDGVGLGLEDDGPGPGTPFPATHRVNGEVQGVVWRVAKNAGGGCRPS